GHRVAPGDRLGDPVRRLANAAGTLGPALKGVSELLQVLLGRGDLRLGRPEPGLPGAELGLSDADLVVEPGTLLIEVRLGARRLRAPAGLFEPDRELVPIGLAGLDQCLGRGVADLEAFDLAGREAAGLATGPDR